MLATYCQTSQIGNKWRNHFLNSKSLAKVNTMQIKVLYMKQICILFIRTCSKPALLKKLYYNSETNVHILPLFSIHIALAQTMMHWMKVIKIIEIQVVWRKKLNKREITYEVRSARKMKTIWFSKLVQK